MLNEKSLDSLEALICGSDQIWNGDITGNDLTYICGGEYAKNLLKISYAASAGLFEDDLFNENSLF